MARLSDYLQEGKRTFTGVLVNPAVASTQLRRGKIAWADGEKLVGGADMKPLSFMGGAFRRGLLVHPPTGITGSYNPATDARGLIINSDRNLVLEGASISIDTNGYLYTSSSYQDFLHVKYLVRPVTTFKKIQMWGKTKSATLTSNDGVRIAFNIQHWYDQFWLAELYWNGSAFLLDLCEWNNPTMTVRATASASTALDWPMVWHLTVWYFDDNVWATAKMYQSDNIVDDEALSVSYGVASRPYKSNHGAFFAVRATPGDEWLMRGFSVSDDP